jgi:uncharacterized membrane protein YdjX (TVP38/TMEM64 family)
MNKTSFDNWIHHWLGHLLHVERRTVLIAGLVVVLVFGGYWLEHHVAAVEAWIQGLDHWAGIGFVVLFVVLTPLFFSVDLLCVFAGALFTLPEAVGYVLLATMLSSAVIFFIGRYLAKERVQSLLEKHHKLKLIDQLIQGGGFKILFLLRILPLPFALLSYLFSVSGVQFRPYWLATTGIFFYNGAIAYFGYIAKHMSKQLSQGGDYAGPPNSVLIAGIVLTVLILIQVSRMAKAEISKMNPDAAGLSSS